MNTNREAFNYFVENYLNQNLYSIHLKNNHHDILTSSKNIHDDFDDSLSQFECLTPDFTNSQHMLITVSGPLSQEDNGSDLWKGLLENIEFPIYSYEWNSKSYFKLLLELGIDLLKNELHMLEKVIFSLFISKKSSYWNALYYSFNGGMSIINIIRKTYKKLITTTIESAQASGVLLAHSLMLQFPFRGKSISLVGFSLGTQVIYSCLEELK